jgi:hypothetical protein
VADTRGNYIEDDVDHPQEFSWDQDSSRKWLQSKTSLAHRKVNVSGEVASRRDCRVSMYMVGIKMQASLSRTFTDT